MAIGTFHTDAFNALALGKDDKATRGIMPIAFSIFNYCNR
jgi:hypothetical protein